MLESLNGGSYPGASGQLHFFPSGAGLIDAPLTNGANKRQWSYLNFKKRLSRQFMVADIVRLGTGLLHTWESADGYATRVVEAVQKASE